MGWLGTPVEIFRPEAHLHHDPIPTHPRESQTTTIHVMSNTRRQRPIRPLSVPIHCNVPGAKTNSHEMQHNTLSLTSLSSLQDRSEHPSIFHAAGREGERSIPSQDSMQLQKKNLPISTSISTPLGRWGLNRRRRSRHTYKCHARATV